MAALGFHHLRKNLRRDVYISLTTMPEESSTTKVVRTPILEKPCHSQEMNRCQPNPQPPYSIKPYEPRSWRQPPSADLIDCRVRERDLDSVSGNENDDFQIYRVPSLHSKKWQLAKKVAFRFKTWPDVQRTSVKVIHFSRRCLSAGRRKKDLCS